MRVNGAACRDPERPTDPERERVEVDGVAAVSTEPVYLMLNKPRGLVTTTSDERGRPTVYACLGGAGLPRVVPVGRLDQASEGLLLFTNDTAWAARLTEPGRHVEKEYHVQVSGAVDEATCRRMEAGVVEAGECLRACRAAVLRRGDRNTWLVVVLDEGRNRHLRRMLAALGHEVRRLVRVRIGGLVLGELRQGQHRRLGAEDLARVTRTGAADVDSGSHNQDR